MLHQRRPITGSEAFVSSLHYLDKLHQASKAESCSTGSEASSTIASSFSLQGPSRQVFTQLCCPKKDASERLLSVIRATCKQLNSGAAAPCPEDCLKAVMDQLQDMHVCVVEMDYNLEEYYSQQLGQGASEADTLLLEDCRQWLKQAQGYVIHLQRHLEALAAGTAGADAWRLAYREAAETLARVAEHISMGGVSDEDAEHSPLLKPVRSRLVSTTSQLPYGAYWSKKIAI